jgi:hypothetical protein
MLHVHGLVAQADSGILRLGQALLGFLRQFVQIHTLTSAQRMPWLEGDISGDKVILAHASSAICARSCAILAHAKGGKATFYRLKEGIVLAQIMIRSFQS